MSKRVSTTVKKSKFSKDEVCEPIDDLKTAFQYRDIIVSKHGNHQFTNDPFMVQNGLGECHQELNTLRCAPRADRHTVPKTIVCHDFKGGYQDDKYIYGHDSGNGYTFYRWSSIDIFIYFSHHFLTIPPPGWIITGHRNNVKVLGTVITEGDGGKTICDAILKSNETWHDFAKCLINICLLYGFDGWFLNIENNITDTKPLIEFIDFLTKEMHKINPEFLVLWYDSVCQNGRLDWQNELNDNNKCFFDVCDGIFLNYGWKDQSLTNSVLTAGHRSLDVFVGIDVYGRGCFGGGGFKSYLAANEIHKHNLSMAIFAPGWTYETMKKDADDFFHVFCQRDHVFWLNLYPFFYRKPIQSPFTTTFDLGSNQVHYYLNSQQKFLCRPIHCGTNDDNSLINELVEKCDCMQLSPDGCKPNTMSCQISDANLHADKKYIHKLFTCNIEAKINVAIGYVVKSQEENQLEIITLMRDQVGRYHSVHFLPGKSKSYSANGIYVFPLADNDPAVEYVKRAVNFGSISDGWIVNYYIYSVPKSMTVCDIYASLNGSALLFGGFSLRTDLWPIVTK